MEALQIKSQLDPLRRLLDRIAWKRLVLRQAMAWAGWGAAVCVALLLVFALDVLFRMRVSERVVCLLIAFFCLGVAFARLAWPHMRWRENRRSIALLVERRQSIESDLVAALQFEASRSRGAGRDLDESSGRDSSDLRQAVIERAIKATPQVLEDTDLSLRPLKRRSAGLLLASSALVSVFLFFPQHARVFGARLLLRQQSYPTATTITSVTVDGKELLARPPRNDPRTATVPAEQSVEIYAEVVGAVPDSGFVELRLTTGSPGRSTIRRLVMAPVRDSLPLSAGTRQRYRARIERLPGDAMFRVVLGDARTEDLSIELLELPRIEVQCTVVPPDYAIHQHKPPPVGSLHITALEGSAVSFQIRSTNKQLVDVDLRLADSEGQEIVQLQQSTAGAGRWTLDLMPPNLASVSEDIRFQCRIVDQHGLAPKVAPAGTVRVRRDALPQAVVATAHRKVVPAASPSFDFQMSDDFGISTARLHIEMSDYSSADDRVAGTPNGPSETAASSGTPLAIPIELFDRPLLSEQLPWQGQVAVDLSQLALEPGDLLKVRLEIRDFRGELPSRIGASQPVYLEIADQAAVLAEIADQDQQTEKELTDLIETQNRVRENTNQR
jgi:hypothetical protein